MSVRAWRNSLELARDALRAGDATTSMRAIDRVLAALDDRTLLTTTEAASLLGVRSANTVKGWVRTGYLHGVQRGGRTMIPLAEVERIQDSDQVRRVQSDDALLAVSEPLGEDEGLNQEELDALSRSRHGTLPWQRTESDKENDDGRLDDPDRGD